MPKAKKAVQKLEVEPKAPETEAVADDESSLKEADQVAAEQMRRLQEAADMERMMENRTPEMIKEWREKAIKFLDAQENADVKKEVAGQVGLGESATGEQVEDLQDRYEALTDDQRQEIDDRGISLADYFQEIDRKTLGDPIPEKDQEAGEDAELTPGEWEASRDAFEALGADIRSLYVELDERRQKALTQVIEDSNVEGFLRAGQALHASFLGKSIDGKRVEHAIEAIASAMGDLGDRYESRPQVMEEKESLERLLEELANIHLKVTMLIENFSRIKKEEAGRISEQLQALQLVIETRADFIERLASAAGEYLR